MSTRVLVTGASGHLGSHLIPLLEADGLEVVGLDMVAPATSMERFVQADLADRQALDHALDGVDLVVHCASIHPWKPYADDQYLDANVKGTWHLYSAAAEKNIDRVVLTSSIAAVGYGPVRPDGTPDAALWPLSESYRGVPRDLYSFTKHAQETTARLFAANDAVRTLALRPPAFMPRPELDQGLGLLGVWADVEDVASAHLAAVRTFLGMGSPCRELERFEAIFVTNSLPYTAGDGDLLEGSAVSRPLVAKYWPEAADWFAEQRAGPVWLPGVYDLMKARVLLGWKPTWDFARWYEEKKR